MTTTLTNRKETSGKAARLRSRSVAPGGVPVSRSASRPWPGSRSSVPALRLPADPLAVAGQPTEPVSACGARLEHRQLSADRAGAGLPQGAAPVLVNGLCATAAATVLGFL